MLDSTTDKMSDWDALARAMFLIMLLQLKFRGAYLNIFVGFQWVRIQLQEHSTKE